MSRIFSRPDKIMVTSLWPRFLAHPVQFNGETIASFDQKLEMRGKAQRYRARLNFCFISAVHKLLQ